MVSHSAQQDRTQNPPGKRLFVVCSECRKNKNRKKERNNCRELLSGLYPLRTANQHEHVDSRLQNDKMCETQRGRGDPPYPPPSLRPRKRQPNALRNMYRTNTTKSHRKTHTRQPALYNGHMLPLKSS